MARVRVPDSPSEKEAKKATTTAADIDTASQVKKDNKTNTELKAINGHLAASNKLLQQISIALSDDIKRRKDSEKSNKTEKKDNKDKDLAKLLSNISASFNDLSKDLKKSLQVKNDKKNALDSLAQQIKQEELEKARIHKEYAALSLTRAKESYARSLLQWERAEKRFEYEETIRKAEEKRRQKGLYKETGLYKAMQGVKSNEKTPLATAGLEILTGGLLNSSLLNALGVDKALGFAAKSIVQAPFKALGNAWRARSPEEKAKKALEADREEERKLNLELLRRRAKQNSSEESSTPINNETGTANTKTSNKKKSSSATQTKPTEKL